jgi:hypothetical protein
MSSPELIDSTKEMMAARGRPAQNLGALTTGHFLLFNTWHVSAREIEDTTLPDLSAAEPGYGRRDRAAFPWQMQTS